MPVNQVIHPFFKKVQTQQVILYIQKAFLVFFIWFLLGTPFPTYGIPGPFEYTATFFEWLVKGTSFLFGWSKSLNDSRLFSDSVAMYVHCLNGIVLAWILAAIWHYRFGKKNMKQIWYYVVSGIRYFLALQLFTYGFTKIFQWQFAIPEANILFTPVGQLHNDTLFWTTIGASGSYQIITGIIECVTAVLLLFRSTTKAGALISTMIFAQVLLLNIGFNISVKLFSMHLLIFSGIVWLNEKYSYLITPKEPPYVPLYKFIYRKPYILVKSLIIMVIVMNALWPYYKSGNYNDATFKRPYFTGAYEVKSFFYNNEELPPLLTNQNRWRRIFIHRGGFFIVQDMNDNLNDFQMKCDTLNKKLELYDELTQEQIGRLDYECTKRHYFMELTGIINGNRIKLKLNHINLDKQPLLQKEFTWTSN